MMNGQADDLSSIDTPTTVSQESTSFAAGIGNKKKMIDQIPQPEMEIVSEFAAYLLAIVQYLKGLDISQSELLHTQPNAYQEDH